MKLNHSLAAVIAMVAVTAAMGQPSTERYPVFGADPAVQLSANLVVLAQNPRDVNALIGAGQSAVAVGDGNAALAFLARAEEISPRNGRIKAALGSALLLLERPGEALKLFSEASALGIPDSDIAADRGLAHDLKGESRKAQRDYLLAQRIAPSDELTRRLALSYGISGDRSNALSMLDPLLRKQDQAAWRARAFILAMTGNLDDAEDIARSVMPPGVGIGMRPFLRRLAALNPADRAMAVNFGTMPGDGTRLASAESSTPYAGQAGGQLIPAGDGLAPRIDEQVKPVTKMAVTRDPRRRPGALDPAGKTSNDRQAILAALPDVPLEDAGVSPSVVPPNPVTARTERRVAVRLATPSVAAAPKDLAAISPPAISPPAILQPVAGSQIVKNEANPAFPSAVFEVSAASQSSVVAIPSIVAEAGRSSNGPAGATGSPALASAGMATIGNASVAAPPVAVPDPVAVEPRVTPAQPVSLAMASDSNDPSVPASAIAPIASAPTPGFSEPVTAGTVAIATFAQPSAPPIAPPASPAVGVQRLADILAGIEPEAESAAAPLPTAAELRAVRIAQQKKLAAQAKADADAKVAKDAKETAKREAAKNPPRVWVQVATGANEAGLPSTWKRIREKSPQLFKGMSAASVPFKSTNRLLVGPIKSQAEARALVNALQKAGMAGTTYSSEAGQEIARIASK